jgi:exoribonuclease R
MKITIEDRTYSSFFIDDKPFNNNDIDPINLKLFNEDEFSYTDSNFELINSPTRNAEYLTGILNLDDNKTFGRTRNKKRLLYRCFPDDKKLPTFLIPYEIDVKFNKNHRNKFILFKFDEWNKLDAHPIGLIVETIGNVDDIESVYSYNLHSKNLHHSIKSFSKQTYQLCNQPLSNNITQKQDSFTFSIDPHNCLDFDDAFSIEFINNKYCVSVFIADVVYNIEKHQLWDYFTERVSNIYLPNKRLTMIPQNYTHKFCSLTQNKMSKSICIKSYFNADGTPDDSMYSIDLIDVFINQNFEYEESSLLNNTYYLKLLHLTQLIEPTTKDSHELVAFWMVKTNYVVADFLNKSKQGIFRKSTITNDFKHDLFDRNVISTQYVSFDETEQNDLKIYTHATSPIRRIADLFNQCIIHIIISPLSFSEKGYNFVSKWSSRLDFINKSMKSIRKVQSDCKLLDLFHDKNNNPDKIYVGIILQKKTSVSLSFTYTIFVKELKIYSKIIKTNVDLNLFTEIEVCFYYFGLKERKVRCSIR